MPIFKCSKTTART